MSDLMHAFREITENADGYRLAERYYRGRVDEVFASRAVRRLLGGSVNAFNINLARRPVDAVLDRMTISSVPVPDGEQVSAALVDRVWRPNRLDRYSKRTHWGALTYGDAYLIVWPGDDEGTVDVHYNSPIGTRAFYDDEDPRRKRFAAKLWREGDGDDARTRVNLYYADRIERWTTRTSAEPGQDSDFEPYLDDDERAEAELAGEPGDVSGVWPTPNPYGQVPVFHFRTDEPYGVPEHEGAFGPQNAITKLSATQMGTTDFQGFPQRYALMEQAALDDLVDWGDDEEENETRTRPADRESSLQAHPGTLWRLPNVKSVGQFDPANADAFIKPIGMYVRLMAAATAKPLRFFDPVGQIPSGEALRADEAPLAARIRSLEDEFTDVWSEALVFALYVLDVVASRVDMQWDPVQVIDDVEGWRTVQAKLDAGVPYEQVMTEAGYASDLVKRWAAERAAGQNAGPSGSGTDEGAA